MRYCQLNNISGCYFDECCIDVRFMISYYNTDYSRCESRIIVYSYVKFPQICNMRAVISYFVSVFCAANHCADTAIDFHKFSVSVVSEWAGQ